MAGARSMTVRSVSRPIGGAVGGAVDRDADPAEVEAFQQHVAADLGAAMSAPLTWLGDKLGLWQAMADGEPVTPAALAARVGTNERMTREWLCAQAAGGYVCHDPETGAFDLPPAHAAVLVDGGPAALQGGFDCVAGALRSIDRAMDAMRTGKGLGWHHHHDDFHRGVERFFEPSYASLLVNTWLPALGAPVDKLAYGGSIADVGCGRGLAAVLLAKAFPLVRVDGFDAHEPSIRAAKELAQSRGVDDRCAFNAVDAGHVSSTGYDLVCLLDCLHDMADPFAVARRAKEMVAPDGVVMVVEPIAGDTVDDNLHPLGRLLYSVSTLACTPCSLDGDGPGLGAQAGPSTMAGLLRSAGFSEVRVATTTTLNHVLDARP